MAQIVCIIGNKGGTGKTTLSHMLCQGMGLLGQRAVCVLTDTEREPLSPEGRRYLTADARTSETLAKVTDKLRGLKGWMGVIDGGGNRREMDRRLYAMADIVLLPFRDSHEDIRTVIRDLEHFPKAWALPSQWPTNPWQREAAARNVEQMLSDFKHRVLEPISTLSASKLLLQKTIPAQIPTPLANSCRGIARQVLDLLEVLYEDSGDEREEAQDTGASAPAGAAETPSRESATLAH